MEQTILTQGPTTLIAEKHFLYGLIAEFENPDDLVTAARRTREAGYRRVDAYTPFPVEELSEALGFRDTWVPLIMLVGGLCGAFGGFLFLFYCLKVSYEMNVGGEPIYAWPVWVPITFECTVLLASLFGVIGMFLLNGLPAPYHPVFDAPNFEHATSSRFFLCIEADDPNFDLDRTRQFMETFGAAQVSEVELKK